MKNEKTLVVIKPDGVQRSLVGEIIRRLERSGLKIVAMKMVVAEKDFVEKRAASNVVMYTIFIFIAASFGAPLLFSLSSLLVETLVNTLSQFPVVETQSSFPMLFSLSNISISINFIKYFSLFFIIFIDFFAALVLGLVSKGEEREGMKYLLPMLLISLALFFVVRFILRGFVAGLFS